MYFKSNAIYLPIRSFGDFIISASVIKNYSDVKVPVLLPNYFKEIYKTIDGDLIFDFVSNINFNNQPAYFEMYKVRNFKNIFRLLNDIKITSELDSSKNYLLDFRSRRLSFLNKNFSWPNDYENIYQAKYKLFKKFFPLKDENLCKIPLQSSKFNNVIIFPESRIQSKEINNKLLFDITSKFQNSNITVARYSSDHKITDNKQNAIYYSNFDQLIKLINSHDLVISSESLPYHLASFYNKPHFVIYQQTKHFKATFMTAFMNKNSYYTTFDGKNTAAVLTKLDTVIA